MKKNMKILLSFILAFVITVGIFYLYQKQDIQNQQNNKKKENKICYLLEKNEKKRIIFLKKIENAKINNMEVVSGEDIYFENGIKKQDFVFNGVLKDRKNLVVFGKDKGKSEDNFYERRYKKYTNGILEGIAGQDNYEKKVVKGKNFFYIKDKNKIKYDGKFAILENSCK